MNLGNALLDIRSNFGLKDAVPDEKNYANADLESGIDASEYRFVFSNREGGVSSTMDRSQELEDIIKELNTLTGRLEAMYPGRHFTPDGHLVGSIGEVFAAERYGISLFTASSETHDGKAPDGRLVQIKATQRRAVAISSEPDYLLVFSIDDKGQLTEVYNGPGRPVWHLVSGRKRPKTGQYQVSLARLRRLNESVLPEERIRPVA